MIAHRFAMTPRMDFQTKGLGLGEVQLTNAHVHGRLSQSLPSAPRERSVGWFGFWGIYDGVPDFIVEESVPTAGDAETVGDATNIPPNLA